MQSSFIRLQLNFDSIPTTVNEEYYTVSQTKFSDLTSSTSDGGLAIYLKNKIINLNVLFSSFNNIVATKTQSDGAAIRIYTGNKIYLKCLNFFHNSAYWSQSLWVSKAETQNPDNITATHLSSTFCYVYSNSLQTHLDVFGANKLLLTNINYSHSESKATGLIIHYPPNDNLIKFMNYYNQSGGECYFYYDRLDNGHSVSYTNFVDNDLRNFVTITTTNKYTIHFYNCNLIFSTTVPTIQYCEFHDIYTNNVQAFSTISYNTVENSYFIDIDEHKCSLNACTHYHPQYNNEHTSTQHLTIIYICSLAIGK